ncbi:MAG: hypothetical protein D4R72_06925 [Nitrosopumilales archaeon]|nr:MAG: hypothetical protein D4R72_06925 [Nitrosopumilales archaeon]
MYSHCLLDGLLLQFSLSVENIFYYSFLQKRGFVAVCFIGVFQMLQN